MNWHCHRHGKKKNRAACVYGAAPFVSFQGSWTPTAQLTTGAVPVGRQLSHASFLDEEGSKDADTLQWTMATDDRILLQQAGAGVVNARSLTCANQGCTNAPYFGVEDGRTRVGICSHHARAGMGNVKRKRCAHQGCSKEPSSG